MTDLLMQLISDYGLTVLALSIVLACMAIPLPSSILLVLSGAFVASGDMELLSVLTVAFLSAVVGDQLAYGLGTFGGNALEDRMAKKPKYAGSIAKAKAFSAKWGGLGVFLSRWLVAPIGPWINFASGMSDYRWRWFTLWAVLGEVIWIGGYVTLGRAFSSNAIALAEFLGNVSWMLIGAIMTLILGARLVKAARPPVKTD